MRIVFVGAIDFSRHCLREVLRDGGDVVAVITLSKQDGGFHSDYADLSPVANEFGAPVHYVKKIGAAESIALVRSLEPDVIFVFGWSQLVSKELLDVPPLGCIGSHPAMLPRNRGRHPLIWPLVKGDDSSGLTFFYLDEGADSGDILWQRPFAIAPDDDAGTLYQRIKALASDAIAEFLPQLASGTAPRMPQDHSQATYLRKRTEKDGEIDWREPSQVIHNLTRGLTRPYHGAHTYLDGSKVVVWRTRLPHEPTSHCDGGFAPGTVFGSKDKLCVAAGDGCLCLVEYKTANGRRLTPGDRLGA